MKRTLTLLAATTALAVPALAEDLSVVGSWSSLPLHNT
ncbi:MAG: C4-dicarboxylate ABC transporter substrate-binding protein, partial [Tateyamaria sp.]|nr:C4-dicarboxylate ABC transporter substrate-binding protein [Tateyamaria sp.]